MDHWKARLVPFTALAASSLFAAAHAQNSTLTLEQAIAFARERNGTVRAAMLDVQAASSRVRQAQASFFPQITPSYRYRSSRSETFTGATAGFFKSEDRTSQLDATWRLIDSGERDWGFRSASRLSEAQRLGARQTLRSTLFVVHRQFFDALRAQELVKVFDAQVKRAEKILESTDRRIEVGDAPKKDRLQALADHLNAKVDLLQAQNRTATAEADLRATIGWDPSRPLPALAPVPEPQPESIDATLESVVAEGLANRPDLASLRKRLEAERFGVLRADREASFTWSLDAAYSRQFSSDVSDDRTITFLLSYPLFDGFRSRESAREAKLGLESSRAEYGQSERDARAEIEAAYLVLQQDALRLEAAKAARDAARQNYDAAQTSFSEGAEGTSLITVLTAQVSLAQAESNYVEAQFDYYVSEVRLRLAAGRKLAGETE
jgi:outer membrane protein